MIKRDVYKPLKSHLDQKEISLIVGPRQAGKTTIMRLLKEDLDKKNKRTLFLSLDTETDRSFFKSQQLLLQKISLEIGKEKGFVFIDEIQRKEDAGIFLKGIYDMDLPYKFVVSGSGSVELKEKIHESLVGRKRLFEIYPLSFEEFANYKLDYSYEEKLNEFFTLHKADAHKLLDEYLNFGGYPRVVLAQTIDEKRQIIADIYQSYLEKDIIALLKVIKSESFTHLVRILASQIGNLVNVSELSSTLGISAQTVKDYLWYLEKTFIIRKITPYFKNMRKEITKTNIIYFVDLGIKNYATGQFGSATRSLPQGFLFQNFVYNNLRQYFQNKISSIHFWRTQDKAEVDIIINTPKEAIPLEVKYQVFKKTILSRSYRSFISKYRPSKGYIIHLGDESMSKAADTKIFFLPFYKIGNIVKNIS